MIELRGITVSVATGGGYVTTFPAKWVEISEGESAMSEAKQTCVVNCAERFRLAKESFDRACESRDRAELALRAAEEAVSAARGARNQAQADLIQAAG